MTNFFSMHPRQRALEGLEQPTRHSLSKVVGGLADRTAAAVEFFLIAEKRRQMQAPYVMWPRGIPWAMNSPLNMPIVLWLSKPRERKRGSPP